MLCVTVQSKMCACAEFKWCVYAELELRVRLLQTVLTGVFVCVRTDMQTALYELCWQVVQGNLKLDLAASVLGDMMVNIGCRQTCPFCMSTVPYSLLLVRHGSSLYMFGIFQRWYLCLDLLTPVLLL